MHAKSGSWHIGIIGGSGLADGIGLDDAQEIRVRSPFGEPSGPVTQGTLGGVRFTFLARHGAGSASFPSTKRRKNPYTRKCDKKPGRGPHGPAMRR